MGDKKMVKCRTCGGVDHWTSKCPSRNTILNVGKLPDDQKPAAPGGDSLIEEAEVTKLEGSKLVPPSLRNRQDGTKRGKGPNTNTDRRGDSILISNLSESTTRTDLHELVKPFGHIRKLYLAEEKQTGLCKGFAYVHFKFQTDATKAIQSLNGHSHNQLSLSADWTKPLDSQ